MGPSPTDQFTQGVARYRAGAYGQAATVFEHLLQHSPGNAGVMRMLGLCRLRLGEPADAVDLLGRAYALAPEDPQVRLDFGIGLHAVARYREAAEQFALCRELMPGDPAPFLNLASALVALGKGEAALDAARRARRRAPGLPEAHYTLGLALLALGRIEEAQAAFAASLERAPGFADAWVNLGVAFYRANDIEAAKRAMRQALAVVPGHRAAAANLGVFLRLSGEVEASETLLRDLLARDPAADEARLNLAAELLHEDRAGEALALLDDRPMPAEPRLAQHWELERSIALLMQGRVEEARSGVAALGEPAAALRPLVLWRRVLLALREGDPDGARSLAAEMAAVLTSEPAVLPEHRIMGHFDLARFWSREDERDLAFPHWVEGHRLLGRVQPFSRGATSAFFDANIAQLGRDRFQAGPRAQNRDPTPVFIIGMPRSGTTLTEQIIAAHAQAFGAGERPALARAFRALGGGALTPDAAARIAALDAEALDRAAAAYLDELHALAPDAARIVDKLPGNFNHLGLVPLMLPGARIIHCARDPRDIGLSIFTIRFYGHHPYAHDLADLGWYIAQYQRLMKHWHSVLPNPMLTVQLQDWVADFTGTLRRVLEFLDLPYDPACERFYEQQTRVRTASRFQVRQPVNARGLGRWRPYEQYLQPLIEELAAGGALPAE